jgi:DNA-binding NtrC family response regulator
MKQANAARLILDPPGGRRSEVALGDETWLGRSSTSTVVLDDASVSRRHALIRRDDRGDHVIIDLGSSNGTFVNGGRVNLPLVLQDGDELRLGDVKLTFASPSDADRAPPERELQFSSARATLDRDDAASSRVRLIGTGAAMGEVFRLMARAAASPIPVLVQGETGTGKELVARGIHENSPRAHGPFIAINCSALPEGVLESELFGHRRGSFTGAVHDRPGLFEAAASGTLFLDEIGEMPLSTQPKLLRFLQDGEILRVGENRARRVDARVISATNRDLEREVAAERFRSDLYYRLSALVISLPPLRERREDIPLVAERVLAAAAARHRRRIRGITRPALAAMAHYDWPGNVRELENEIQRVVALAHDGDWVDVDQLSDRLRRTQGRAPAAAASPPEPSIELTERAETGEPTGDLREAMASFERSRIADVLAQTGGNVSEAARVLGLSRGALHRKLKEHGLR